MDRHFNCLFFRALIRFWLLGVRKSGSIISFTTYYCSGFTCGTNIVKPRFLYKTLDLWSYINLCLSIDTHIRSLLQNMCSPLALKCEKALNWSSNSRQRSRVSHRSIPRLFRLLLRSAQVASRHRCTVPLTETVVLIRANCNSCPGVV